MVSIWLLRTALFAAAVGGGLVLADWMRPVAMNAPEAASLPVHLQVAVQSAAQPTAAPQSTPNLPSPAPAATSTAGASAVPPPATAVPILAIPLASVPQTQRVSGMELTLIISPGVAGPNTVELFFFDAAGTWAGVTTIEFRLQLAGSPAPQAVVSTQPLHPGHAYSAGVELGHAGVWQVDVRLDGEATNVTGSFQFLLP